MNGAAVYTRTMLSFYDVLVLTLSLPGLWGCSARRLLDFYDQHVGDAHLDVGVGTGYFLDKCRFPGPTPAVTLLDLNPNCLERAARRLRRHAPERCLADVLQPLPSGLGPFDSIALSLVLHCLPGTMATKAEVLGRLRPLLKRGGRLFGSTILGAGVSMSPLSRIVMRRYNATRIFSNLADDRAGLEAGLARHFTDWTVRTQGLLALFVARV